MVDRLLPGLAAQQKGTTARGYSNKTSLVQFCVKLCNEVFVWEVCTEFFLKIAILNNIIFSKGRELYAWGYEIHYFM